MDENITHIVNYSGGIGSYLAAKRVIKKYGKENTILLFADTYIEDEDLYKFLIYSSYKLYQKDCNSVSINLPKLEDMINRKNYIEEFFLHYTKNIPNFIRIRDGRDVWELMNDRNFISNTRIDNCSQYLKRNLIWKYIHQHYSEKECIVYLGIDWSEAYRLVNLRKYRKPYKIKAPLINKPFLSKKEMFSIIEKDGLDIPRLYRWGFQHNNCGGFCVKAGQGHFKILLKNLPEVYKYHEEEEQKLIKKIDKNVSLLRKSRDKIKLRYTLKQLREDIENDKQIDKFDIGGCGCAVD